jgi:H+/Cl- antiporter ClcA
MPSFILKWLGISTVIGILIGSASAGFLTSLTYVTAVREAHPFLIYFLPLAGFLVGLMYHLLGKDVEGGNNNLIDTIHDPREITPFRMAPLIYIGTIATHLFGGSAGREGTGLQMAGAIADQFSKPFRLSVAERKTLMIAAIAAGFGSVFGTPLAGAIFALEVYMVGTISYEAVFPAFAAGIIADTVTRAWNVGHAHNHIAAIPPVTALNIVYAVAAGLAFGLCAALFCKLMDKTSSFIKSTIRFAPLRPLLGGAVVVVLVVVSGTTRYTGLGTRVIAESFVESLPWYDAAAKFFMTIITLGSGFKGGEVTPLFFIGSTLGNSLAAIIPLPFDLLAAMGLVAVFAGASNTPLACIVLGLELNGSESGIFIAIACVVSYLVSGHNSIYRKQRIGQTKHARFQKDSGRTIHDIQSLDQISIKPRRG